MKLVVITCEAYSDAMSGFMGLLERFWPDHPEVVVLSDGAERKSWCRVLSDYVNTAEDDFLLMQEDMFISAPVRTDLVGRAFDALRIYELGAFRIYPCPGFETDEDVKAGPIKAGEPYRTSLQATVWNPDYLRRLLKLIVGNEGSAADFEIRGNKAVLCDEVYAWNRNWKPWPIEYICSAITRGKWNPGAKRLCDQHGIEVDWTRREFANGN